MWMQSLGIPPLVESPISLSPSACWVVTGGGESYCPWAEGLWRRSALSPGPIPSRPLQCLEKAQNISSAPAEALVGCARGSHPFLGSADGIIYNPWRLSSPAPLSKAGR